MKTFILLFVMLSMLSVFATDSQLENKENPEWDEMDVCRDLTHQSEDKLQNNPELLKAISECLAPQLDPKSESFAYKQ